VDISGDRSRAANCWMLSSQRLLEDLRERANAHAKNRKKKDEEKVRVEGRISSAPRGVVFLRSQTIQ